MNKKGFTLVEVLGVMVLLGILALIMFPSVDKYIKRARTEMYDTQINNIVLSAKNWGSDNLLELPKTDGDTKEITLGFLMDEGYVDLNLINPKTKSPLSRSSIILIKKNGNKHEYQFLDN